MKHPFALILALPLLGAGPVAGPDRWRDQPHGPLYVTAPPMNETVERRLIPQVDALLERLLAERRDMMLGGVKVFEAGDKFLPGKIASAMAYRLLDVPPSDPRAAQRLADFAAIADLTVDDPDDTWGAYYYISALYRLHRAGLLDRAVRPETLGKLRAKLDWRRFVRPDLTLIDLPNNYYGVAFSIARLRFLLGWDDATGSDALFARMIDHYRRYSGAHGFADETEGEGRFDRYSMLLIGEIAQRLVETGMPATPEVKTWLRRSAELMLLRMNRHGEGWEYGRSIGTYGETAFLEVLTAAARFKVLTPIEERMAYAFSSRVAARYADFWIDPASGSVDMWDQGRRTDTYRGKHRIFGENLSLARQFFYTDAIWNGLGYRGARPDPGFAAWLDTLPTSTTTWFARGAEDRALVTVRDRGTVIGLPIINGAVGQHMHNPYFPVPFSPGLLQGAADAGFPQLTPRIALTDGSVLMPLAWFRDMRTRRVGASTIVSWRQDALDRMGGDNAVKDARASIVTRYVLAPGRITRSDILTPAKGTRIARIDLEFASFSDAPRASAPGAITFGSGQISGFATTGFGKCVTAPAAAPYSAPTGAFHSVVKCGRDMPPQGPVRLGWTLLYRAANN